MSYINNVLNDVYAKNNNEKEFCDAAKEILSSIEDYIITNPEIEENQILERFINPERVISFRVCWLDDNNKVQVNTGYRVQFNSAIGPYKGGLRFHPSVNLSIIKFLALEQTLKNALTGLPMGGAKGGADFDPKGKSDSEIMRFCQAFMQELYRHIGQFTDIPAGDIGVGAKEIGYMYGMYKKIRNENTGVLTGKGLSYGGSLARKEATGYGLCYFTNKALEVYKNESFKNKKVIISGSGNVALYAAYKARELGACVVAMSDSNGVIFNENGLDLDYIKELKEVKKSRIKEYLNKYNNATYYEGAKSIWKIKCDITLPCATQNEIDLNDAKELVKNGIIALCEGANMPCSLDASLYFIEKKVIYGPAKAANAGGVLTSGLEMSQNSIRMSWSFEEVDSKLKEIMERIFINVYNCAIDFNDKYNTLKGANILGFKKVSDAMIQEGII